MKTRVMLIFSLRELCNIILYTCTLQCTRFFANTLLSLRSSLVSPTLAAWTSPSCFLAVQLSTLPVAHSSRLVFPCQLLLSLLSVWPIQRHFLCITDFTIQHSYLKFREVLSTAQKRYGNNHFLDLTCPH